MRASHEQDLLAVASKVSMATVGWLVVEAPPAWQSLTIKRHQTLLAHARRSTSSSSSRGAPAGSGPRFDRSSARLLDEINQIVSEAVAQAADGIARVSQCDVDYELVFVTQGHEEIRDRVKLGVVPFFTGAPEVLQLNQASLAFPQKHQAAMSRYVALHQELDFARTWRGFELQDDPSAVETDLSREIATLEVQAALLVESLPGPLRAQLMATAVAVSAAVWAHWPVVEAVPLSGSDDDLLNRAAAFIKLGAMLQQPLPLHARPRRAEVQRAQSAWWDVEDAGATLRVAAEWLTALAQPRDEGYCEMCFRHWATRKRCREHRASGTTPIEVRTALRVRPWYLEHLLSTSQQGVVRRALKGIEKFAAPSEFEAGLAEAQRQKIPAVIERPAAVLAKQLNHAHALFGPSLESEVEDVFTSLLSAATRVFATREVRTLTERVALESAKKDAPTWLSLKNFLLLWYGDRPISIGPETADGGPVGNRAPGRNRRLDSAHPVLHGGLPDPETTLQELLRQRAWIEAEVAVQDAAQVDVAALYNVPGGQGTTLASLAAAARVTRQAVQQAVARRARSSQKRPRVNVAAVRSALGLD